MDESIYCGLKFKVREGCINYAIQNIIKRGNQESHDSESM